jgi:HK97 family phage major capsid protein
MPPVATDADAVISVKELREKRKALLPTILKMRDNANSKDGFTEEDRANWKKLNDDFNRLDEQIEIGVRAEELETKLNRRVGDGRTGRDDLGRGGADNRGRTDGQGINAWLRSNHNACRGVPISEELRSQCSEAGFEAGSGAIEIRLSLDPGERRDWHNAWKAGGEQRALSGNLDTAGGALVDQSSFTPALEINRLAYGGVLQVADVIRTEDNGPIPWPTTDDTGNVGARLNEQQAATDADPLFGKVVFNAYEYSSKIIKIPNAMFRSTRQDLGALVGKMAGIRLGRKANVDFTTGIGVNGPRGILLDITAGQTTAKSTSFTFDDFISLEHSIDSAYREDPGAGYMLHDTILANVRLLKSGTGQYLWTDGTQSGKPARLNGRPYTINMQMVSTIATGNKTVIFGALPMFKVREVASIRLIIMRERYGELDTTAYVAFQEMDAALLDAGTKPIKYLTHP